MGATLDEMLQAVRVARAHRYMERGAPDLGRSEVQCWIWVAMPPNPEGLCLWVALPSWNSSVDKAGLEHHHAQLGYASL